MSEYLFLAGTWNYREAGGRSGTKCDTFFLYQDHGIITGIVPQFLGVPARAYK